MKKVSLINQLSGHCHICCQLPEKVRMKRTLHREWFGPKELYTGDCTDLPSFLTSNTPYLALFNMIDYGSKFAWSFLLKDKTALTISNCLKSVFRIPN